MKKPTSIDLDLHDQIGFSPNLIVPNCTHFMCAGKNQTRSFLCISREPSKSKFEKKCAQSFNIFSLGKPFDKDTIN